MRDISSFRKALWCGAAATALLFALFAAVLPAGGNYAGMLGALTAKCFMPALVAGGIGRLGRQPRGWTAMVALYLVAFVVISGLSDLGRARATAVAAAPSAASAPSAPAAADPIVAMVDGSPITKAAVARVYRQRLVPYLGAGGPGTAPIFRQALGLEQAAVQQLVDRRIAMAEARRLGIDVTLADVHARLATLPPFLQGGRYVGEARAVEVLAQHLPWVRREHVLEEFRLELVIERLEAQVTRGLSGAERLHAYEAFIARARSLADVSVDAAVLAQIVRETT